MQTGSSPAYEGPVGVVGCWGLGLGPDEVGGELARGVVGKGGETVVIDGQVGRGSTGRAGSGRGVICSSQGGVVVAGLQAGWDAGGRRGVALDIGRGGQRG